MKTATIHSTGGVDDIRIVAPEGKEMAFDNGLLQHGILSIGEYGASGQKIAAFKDWAYVTFDAEGAGYTIENPRPF